MIPIPGVTLRLYFDGLEMDVSELLRIYDPVDRACNEEFRHAASSRSVTLRYDSLLASRLTSARDIRAEIDVDSVRDFTGRVAPSAVIDSGGAALGADPDVEDIPLEIDDLSALLDTEITMENGIVIDHAVVCDGTLPATSIVHRLLAFAGVSNALTHTIDVELRAVAVDSGTVREHLDTILGEYGYAWRLNEYGQVILVRWMHADPVPTAALNEDNLVGRLKAERLPIEADAVEINWYALKERSQALVYMADLPFGDDNRRSGWPIVPDYLWPEEANAGHAWWEFRDAALASRVNERGAVIPDGDYTSIVTTVNHTIDELFEDGIVRETAVFENRRARVAYRNPEAESKLIYHCNILADVVYRGARNSERADLAFDAKTVDSYDSLYIHDAINAAALCAARATRLKSAAWRYAGVSEDLLAVGTIVAVNDPYSSVSGIAIIIERRHEIETGLYHYRAVGLAANSVTPVSGTTTVLPAPDLRETTGPEGATGRRTALLTLYKWAASAPSSSWPTGSSTYTWATGGWTNPATLNGWVQAPGAGAAGQTLYAVDCLVSDEATTATTAGTWPAAPAPYAVGVAGATGPTGPQGNTGPSGSTP